MLHFHTDIHYQNLYFRVLKLLTKPRSLFESPQIVIPNHSTKLWLQQSLANDLGVCSQIEFLMPLEFVWKQSQAHYKLTRNFNPFRADVLGWKILEYIQKNRFEALSLWSKKPELQQWTAAQNLATALIRYLGEQPQDLLHWQSNPKHWQAQIWQQLLQDLGLESPLDVLQSLSTANNLHSESGIVVFFAVEQMTEYQFEFIKLLSHNQDIHVMLTNPCPEIYWFDSKSVKSVQRTRHFHPHLAEHLNVGHPLLSSLGQNKMALFNAFYGLEGLQDHEIQTIPEPESKSLLLSLKHDIYQLRDQPEFHLPDSSLSIHSCHSKLRQVEVIKDEILERLNTSDLDCKDFIVVAPDINEFKEAIHLVFHADHSSSPEHFYYHIDRMQLDDSNYAQAVLALLCGLHEDMNSENMFELLSHPSIGMKFGVSSEDLPLIKNWLLESNVRSFYSKMHRSNEGFAESSCNTFEFGEHRWLSGFFAGTVDDTPFASVYGDVAGTESLFSGVFAFLRDWFETSSKFEHSRQTPRIWGQWFKSLCLTFVQEDGNDSQQKVFDEIEKVFIQYPMDNDTEISSTLAVQFLRDALMDQQFRPFGRMGVRFQSWENAFVTPAKVLIVMGLDEMKFPHPEPKNDLDAMKDKQQGLRRQIRGRDRNLLLTALTENHEQLILTYCGFDSKTNEPQPPSPLLRELIDHLQEKTGNQFQVKSHHLQGFHPSYFNKDSNNSFHQHHCQAARQLQAVTQRQGNKDLITQLTLPESDDNSLKFDALQAFFKDPLTDFLKFRSEVQLDIYDQPLQEYESFTASGLEKWKLRKICFESGMDHAQKTGILTDTDLARLQLNSINQQVQVLRELRDQLQQDSLSTTIGEIQLSQNFWLDSKQQIQSFCLSELKSCYKDLCQHWVAHLFFNSDRVSHMHCLEQKILVFQPLSEPQKLQQQLIDLWQKSRTEPWIFLPPESFKFHYGKLILKGFDEYKKAFYETVGQSLKPSHAYFLPFLEELSYLLYQKDFIQPLIDHIEVLK